MHGSACGQALPQLDTLVACLYANTGVFTDIPIITNIRKNYKRKWRIYSPICFQVGISPTEEPQQLRCHAHTRHVPRGCRVVRFSSRPCNHLISYNSANILFSVGLDTPIFSANFAFVICPSWYNFKLSQNNSLSTCFFVLPLYFPCALAIAIPSA